MLFHKCVFRSNSANRQGGAIFVNDDNTALSSCEIVSNKAGEEGGGVYVDGRYNITVMGLTRIMDNSSNKNDGAANLALQDQTLGKARIIDAGLYKGSEIHFGTTGSSSVQVSEWVSSYQQQYFKADMGKLTTGESRTVNAQMITSGSVFNNGFYAVSIIGAAGIIGAIVLIVRQKKKNKAKEGGEENDQNKGA